MESSYWSKLWQQRLSRRRALAATGGVAAGAALLAACGGGSTGTNGPAASNSISGGNAPLGQPKMGGTLTSWTTSAPDNAGLDTYLNWSGANCNFTSMIYCKLTRLKVGKDVGPQQYVVDLDLATKLEQPDPTTYIFKLHENAKWQNVAPLNGRQITAQDVVYNINLWHAKGQNRNLTQPWVDTVEAVDNTTVKFKLKTAISAFPLYIGHTGGPFIMPPELKENDQTREKTAASGPFILDKYEVGSALYFKKNPNYYNAPKPYVDGLTWSILKDASTVTSNVRTGALDVALWNGTIGFQDAAALKQATPGSTWLDVEWINVNGWCFDLLDPKFKDERVRQAISVALDREGAFGTIMGPGNKYHTPMPVYAPWWLDPKKDAKMLPFYKRDIARSKQLLSAAGFPDGMNVDYMYQTGVGSNGVPSDTAAAFWQASLKDAGIMLKLNGVEQAVWFQKGQFGQAPGAFYPGAGHFNSDPDEGLSLVFDPKSARSPVTNKQVLGDDATLMDLMNKIKFEFDFNKRKGYVDDVQRHLSEKMYIIGSPSPATYYNAAKRVKNMSWVMHYAYGPIVADAWIDEA